MKIVLVFCLFSVSAFATDITIKVQGMVCSMCAQGITKKFTSMSEVKSVDVNLDNKLVKIQTHEKKDILDSLLKKIITEAGYNVATIERK